MNNIYKLIFSSLLLFNSQLSSASEKPLIRLGLLAFGTANWEMSVIQKQGLETEHYRLQISKMANPQASKIALQSGAVDIIITDWLWVSKQRSKGQDYTFYPYSNTTGALVVAKDSAIKQLTDLKNKKLAIAGGELDKNNLLLRALMQKQALTDVFSSIKKVYGSPPLLSEQIKRKRVDALLTYWHYATRLEAEGYQILMTGRDILQGLGIQVDIPSIGYVFNHSWATQHKTALHAFLQHTQQTKKALCKNNSLWDSIQPVVHASTPKINQLLRQRYCSGLISSWGILEQQAIEQVYQHLKAMSKTQLTGGTETLEAGSFWSM